MDLVRYLPGLFFQNSHTELPTEKVISNSHPHQWGPQVLFQWSQGSSHGIAFPRRNLRKKSSQISTCYFSTTLSHDWAICKRFSQLSLFSRGTLDHRTTVLSSGENPPNVGGGQWLRPKGRAPKQNFSQLLAVLQSLLLISSFPNNTLYIFWSINLLDSNKSVQLKRCTFFPSSEAADHKLDVC